jgi:hypothetical protein
MEEYFGEDYDDYPEEYLPYQAKKTFFLSVGSFEYFREYLPYQAKKHFFILGLF